MAKAKKLWVWRRHHIVMLFHRAKKPTLFTGSLDGYVETLSYEALTLLRHDIELDPDEGAVEVTRW